MSFVKKKMSRWLTHVMAAGVGRVNHRAVNLDLTTLIKDMQIHEYVPVYIYILFTIP